MKSRRRRGSNAKDNEDEKNEHEIVRDLWSAGRARQMLMAGDLNLEYLVDLLRKYLHGNSMEVSNLDLLQQVILLRDRKKTRVASLVERDTKQLLTSVFPKKLWWCLRSFTQATTSRCISISR